MPYTVLWLDGFDEIGSTDQKYVNTTERTGTMSTDVSPPAYAYGRALRLQDGFVGKLLPGAPFTTLFASFDLRMFNQFDVNNQLYLEFWDLLASQIQVSIVLRTNLVTASYDAVLRRGSTDIYTWTDLVTPNLWRHISIKAIIHPTNGLVQIARDGVSLGGFTGNTRNTANTRVDQFRMNMTVNNSRVGIDNLVVATGLDTDPLLPISRVYGANMPNANVAVAWTPSTGSNWQTVDEIPPSDTDYNSTSTPGVQDVFSHAALSSVGSQVLAVKANARAWSDTSDQLQNLVRVSSSDYYGAGNTLNTTYFSYGNIWQNNPATSAPWTPAEAIAAGFGYRRV